MDLVEEYYEIVAAYAEQHSNNDDSDDVETFIIKINSENIGRWC